VQAIRAMLDAVAREAVTKLANLDITPGTIDSIANRIPEVRSKVIPIGQEVAAVKTLLDAALNDPRFALAEKEFKPLLEASAARDAGEEKVRLDRQLAEAQLNQARESSWRAALEKAESDPSIQKATARLDAAKEAENMLR
jgi:hypothetical protein